MRSVLVLSYDWSGRTLRDAAFMGQKLRRDRYAPEDSVLTICWSRQQGSAQHTQNLRIEAVRARFPFFKPLYDILFIYVAPRLLKSRRFRPDVVVIADFALLLAAARIRSMTGAKVEFHLNNLPKELGKTRSPLKTLYARINERVWRSVPDTFVVINETTRAYLLNLGVAPYKIRLRIPDTIAGDAHLIAAAQKGEIRSRYHLDASRHLVLSVGRLEKEKGFEDLLRVFSHQTDDAMLVIVGDGSLRSQLEQLAEELGIDNSVIFAGVQDRTQLWKFYADADVFALLSKSEALGLVFWEAMYMGVPVIGRPVGGIIETIGKEGERGFFWDTSDGAAAFADKVSRAIAKDKEVMNMVAQAKEWVDRKIDPTVVD